MRSSQKARVWTESWVACSMFCPNCGRADISRYAANRPAADFACLTCHEDYELKSKKGRFGPKIVDGAYAMMMQRLAASDNPNLICMTYDLNRRSVTDLFVVPKQFFTADLIEPRPPLGPKARRAGWVGCKIVLDRVPASGRVFVVREGQLLAKRDVQAQWASTLFLRGRGEAARGWLIEVMRCVEAIGLASFTLDDVYAHEARLSALYPANRNVRPKIRQQLQVLRDQGYLRFLGHGRYRRGFGLTSRQAKVRPSVVRYMFTSRPCCRAWREVTVKGAGRRGGRMGARGAGRTGRGLDHGPIIGSQGCLEGAISR